MRALIMGASLSNKGSELMLRALVEQMRVRFPSVDLGLSTAIPSYQRASDLQLSRLAVPLPNVGFGARFYPPWWTRNLFPNRSGAWSWRSVELVLDISGFAYSDQWRTSGARNLKRVGEDVKKRGGRIVLLPQAFGPFDARGHADAMRDALSFVDLAFARDSVSLGHLTALGAECDVRLAPDITLSFGAVVRGQGPESGWVAIVPNTRMLDQGARVWGENYINLLRQAISTVQSAGLEAKVLVHEDQGGDRILATSLVQPPITAPIVCEADPVRLKHMLSDACLVIGSRFHALASSLACGVPVLSLGWSHKYRELLASYGVERFDIPRPDGVVEALTELLDPERRQTLRRQIREAGQTLTADSESMWDAVTTVVNRQLEAS